MVKFNEGYLSFCRSTLENVLAKPLARYNIFASSTKKIRVEYANWKKKVQDSLSHSKEVFESGTTTFGKKGEHVIYDLFT